MKLDDDREALAILDNGINSFNNRARALYNKGYAKGLEAGKREAVEMLINNLETIGIPKQSCETCDHYNETWESIACDGCCAANNHYKPKGEE